MQYSVTYDTTRSDTEVLISALAVNTKFLLLIFLFAFLRYGAYLIPLQFSVEGVYYGISLCGCLSGSGYTGLLFLLSTVLFRLTVVLPYGFLLGRWGLRRSLRFETAEGGTCAILFFTLIVICAASFAEFTAGRCLGRMLFLKFGV